MPFVSTSIIKTTTLNAVVPVRSNSYTGEWVNWSIGDEVKREFIPKKIDFYKENSNAIVFGNGLSRTKDCVDRIVQGNKNKIINYYNVLYVCNLGYTDIEPDFLIVTNKFIASKMPKQFRDRTYTRPEILRVTPDTNLIPINFTLDAGSTGAMLACYHGASKVFLVGFDGAPEGTVNHIYADQQFYPKRGEEFNDLKWQNDLGRVISANPNTIFYRVNTNPPNARSLLRFPNYQIIDHRTFVSLADL